VRAMLNAGWPALFASLSFLTTNLSNSIRCVLGTLQTLARAAGLPTSRDMFLTVLSKAALPPHVVAALDEPQQALSALRSCLT
jgi:hypothetical protein